MSKKSTIILFSFLFIIIFSVAGAFIIGQVYNQLLDELINQHANEKLILAKQTATILEDELKSTEDKLKLISNLPQVRDGSTEICNKKLVEVAALNPRISNLGRVGTDKKFKCSLNKTLIGTDAVRLGPYINQIFNDPSHKPVISRIIKVPTGGYAVALHVPVFDEKGVFDGTIGGAIYFEEFSKKFLGDVTVSDHGYIVLQDDDGTIFYHPQKELIGQNRRPKTEQEVATASAITRLIIKSTKDGSSGTSRYTSTLDNKEKIGAYAPADVSFGRKWIVIVTVPIEEILGSPLIIESRKVFEQLFLLLIVSIVVPSTLLLMYLIFSVFRPIEKIGKAATQLGQGNLDIIVPINSQDEIGELAHVFNIMAIQLKSSYQGLEEKVKSKTQELSKKLEELEKNKKVTKSVLKDLETEKTKISRENAKDEATMQSLGEGLISTDEYAKIVKVNKKAEEMLGFTEKELAGKWIIGAIATYTEKGEPINTEDQPIAEALTTGKLIETTLQIVRKDATRFVAGVAIAPIIFEEKPIGAIVVFRDVTRERDVDRMKTEFISLASHQLRTPLSAMKWFLEMLLAGDAGKLNKDQEEMAKNVDDSNERMIRLVNSLLNVSRIESGRIIVNPQPTDLGELLEGVRKEVDKKLTDKNQKLIISVNHDLKKINLDQELIRQVYMNLLTNAIKYTQKGGEISVFISKKDNQVISQISDNGYGIPKKDHEKLFQKFYRGENVVKLEPDGNGLGMYLVKAIIESSKGKIWFESEEGKGSTFWFSLPLTGMEKKEGEVTLSS